MERSKVEALTYDVDTYTNGPVARQMNSIFFDTNRLPQSAGIELGYEGDLGDYRGMSLVDRSLTTRSLIT